MNSQRTSNQRSVWFAARARNAARRGGWIAALGSIGVAAMLTTLLLVPRALDTRLRQRIAALPPLPDSTGLQRQRDSLLALRDGLGATIAAGHTRDSIDALTAIQQAAITPAVAGVPAGAAPIGATDTSALTPPPVIRTDSAAPTAPRPDAAVTELMARLTRARNSPLPDSYRALAESPLLRDDARVTALVDSIDRLDREREAHAALGGPGARYAALTTQLTGLGRRLVRIAEDRMAAAMLASIAAGPSRAASDSAAANSLLNRAGAPLTDSTMIREDSATLAARRDSVIGQMTRVDSQLERTRRQIVLQVAEREALEQRLSTTLPPTAILATALIVGMACGFGVVLTRELRAPTVGDIAEVERLTNAYVLRHQRGSPPARIERRLRERPGVPPIIDRNADAFVLLHLSLTGVGDVVPRADVLADDATIGAAVALGIAAASARESRTVLVVETLGDRAVLAGLLGTKAKYNAAAVRRGDIALDDALHVVTLDRDAHIDVLLNWFEHSDRESGDRGDDEWAEFRERYDLRLHLVDPARMGPTDARDVIICVRQGSTSLDWLARTVSAAQLRQQRVRAVLVWGRDV